METHHESFHEGANQPLQPFELSEELQEFLRGTGPDEYVMVANASDQGTVYVVKAPGADIAGMRGNIPMQVTHELFLEQEAPVIRSVVKFYDDPRNPLALETFTNVRSEEQRQYFDTLSNQSRYIFAFYDEHLQHQLTKLADNTHGDETMSIFRQALLVSSLIPDQQYDFDHAKAAVMRKTTMR